MKTYFISDLHFNHKNIIKYDSRPFSTVEEMNKEIIKRWNKKVSNDDIVWVLGDVGFFKTKEEAKSLVSQLKGRKFLVKGNHDTKTKSFYEEIGFEFVSNYPIVLKQHFVLSHAPFPSFEKIEGMFFIYGHVHTSPEFLTHTENSHCVCCNRQGYEPIEIQVFNKYNEPCELDYFARQNKSSDDDEFVTKIV